MHTQFKFHILIETDWVEIQAQMER